MPRVTARDSGTTTTTATTTTADIGSLIRRRRHMKLWASQAQLAEITGLPQTTISRLERNLKRPTLREARALKAALGGKTRDYFSAA